MPVALATAVAFIEPSLTIPTVATVAAVADCATPKKSPALAFAVEPLAWATLCVPSVPVFVRLIVTAPVPVPC